MDEYIQKNEYKDLCLSSCVADTVSEFSELAEIKRKQLVYDGSHDIHMNGDEAQIRQLIAILLDNAVKYCDENGIITVSLKKKKRPVIIIKNTYKNVEQLRLDKLFDRFYRADQARTAGTGFGIGLSIAQSIAEHHHGTIKVEKKHEYVYSNEILEQSDILNVL
jgi:signal transduction histidine kinase